MHCAFVFIFHILGMLFK